jgi:hypothetical protein
MKRIYYEKIGSRYKPVAEYDCAIMDAMSKGNHLVMCYPGGRSIHYDIDPAYAPLIAASRVAVFAMSDAIRKAGEIRPATKPLTQEQRDAWEHLIKVFGEDARIIERASAREIAEEGIKALQKEAEKVLTNPSVKLAYDHFLMVAELTKEEKHDA